jgi:aryl sulfotransferase
LTRGIVWLASYPKSGNTWARAFLTAYLGNTGSPPDINDLAGGPIASARRTFDNLVGIEASDLTADEVARCRPDVYRLMAAEGDGPVVVKVHDAYGVTDTGQPLFPADATSVVLYLLRNPLDVAVSFAHHSGVPVSQAVSRLCRDDFAFSSRADGLPQQLAQQLRSWSGHVRSWVDESGLPLLVVRYEDMIASPVGAFTSMVEAAGLDVDAARIDAAIQLSRFDLLRTQEQAVGFKERSPRAKIFFRQGRAGDWRTALTEADARAIIEAHGEVMRRFGYLDADGNPTY